MATDQILEWPAACRAPNSCYAHLSCMYEGCRWRSKSPHTLTQAMMAAATKRTIKLQLREDRPATIDERRELVDKVKLLSDEIQRLGDAIDEAIKENGRLRVAMEQAMEHLGGNRPAAAEVCLGLSLNEPDLSK